MSDIYISDLLGRTYLNSGDTVSEVPQVTGKHVDELRAIDSPVLITMSADEWGTRRNTIYNERLNYLDKFAEAHADLNRRQNLALINDLLKF